MKQRDINNAIRLIGSLFAPSDVEFERALQSKNMDTEAPLRYELRALEFTEHTRVARLSFTKVRTYRTVEKYIQRNNEKHKIYSDWKTKESKVATISLKLTSNVLENLRDTVFLVSNSIVKREEAIELVSTYAFEIIAKLITDFEKAYLMPSWFEKDLLEKERIVEIDLLKSEAKKYQNKIKYAEIRISDLKQKSVELKNKIDPIYKRRANKFLFAFLSILTLGIYTYINSKSRLSEFNKELIENEQKSSVEIPKLNVEINSNRSEIERCTEKIADCNVRYTEKITQILPLGDYAIDNSEFIPLKELSGIDYRKIKGVYIIRNKELDKAYVGQSKDVLKRLKDHFIGTVPKNIIFAEDYYNSNYENKEDLFEVKIEEIETKDELDNRERELIFEYDTFNSGYNKTAGNI